MSTTTQSSTPDSQLAPETTIRIYNTLSKTKQVLRPINAGRIGIYLCGPTVYKPSHIGHMVGPVIFDTIKRYLTYNGFEVNWVVNITDVDDKLIAESKRRNLSMPQIAEEMTADYLENLASLGVDQIDQMPKATEHMDEIIAFIGSLIDQGFAYASDGDVFFDVSRDEDYGKLSNRSTANQQGEGGEVAAKKRNAADFALWKAAKSGEPSWSSSWGEGRPGWHIECSAMSRRLLGETFDIHGGGLDLVFPHHENEIAQSESLHSKPMVNYWMHNGLLRKEAAGKVGGRGDRPADGVDPSSGSDSQPKSTGKMSRSEGAGGLADLIAEVGGETLRFFLLRTHYRSTILFGESGLLEAATALEAFHRFFERFERISGGSFFDIVPVQRRASGEISASDGLLRQVKARRDSFLAKMDDDFNTGGAVSEIFELVRSFNKYIDEQQLEDVDRRKTETLDILRRGVGTLRELTSILGLFREQPRAESDASDKLVRDLMELLIQLRTNARAKKDFESADLIRDGLDKLGIALEDRKDGTGWRLE